MSNLIDGRERPNRQMRIALIGFTSEYFLPFARALQEANIEVYWVHSLRSFTHYLLKHGIGPDRILDLSDASLWQEVPHDAVDQLSQLEAADLPRINNIILMDRLLRQKPYAFAISYLAYSSRAISTFFIDNGIGYVGSGRDTALQLLGMLVCRKLDVVWSGTTYLRLPIERYMFTKTHETDHILPLGVVTDDARKEAQSFLDSFRHGVAKPYVRPSSMSWGNVFRRFPLHLQAGWQLLLNTRYDRGNDFARYTLPSLIRMWLQKKINLHQSRALIRLQNGNGSRPFLLFGLHRQPESSIDVIGAYYSDQYLLVQTIARSMPLGYELLVKLHISDVDGWPSRALKQFAALPGVRLISPLADSRELLKRAAMVVTNSGTMAYEAGLMGKPAITFSKVHFNSLPTVRYCSSVVALPALIDELLSRQPQTDDDQRVLDVVTEFIAHSFVGMPNRSVFHSALTDNDLESLVSAYRALERYGANRQQP
jgi:hypothetical protein